MQPEDPDPNRTSIGGASIPPLPGIIEEPSFTQAVQELGIEQRALDWALMLIDEVHHRDLVKFTLETHRVDVRAFRLEPWDYPPLVIYLRGEADGTHLLSARWADDVYPD